jgi:hypothetical protein
VDGSANPTSGNRQWISFPQWRDALAAEPIAPAVREQRARAIIAFLGFCKRQHAGASVILIKAYLAQLPEQGRSGAREALRWWYRAAGRAAGGLKWQVEVEGRGTAGPKGAGNPGDVRNEEAGGSGERPYLQRRPAGAPPPAAENDLGGADWERELIKACRDRHFLWRTEETYRAWAGRFAAFLRPRAP